MVSVCRPTVQDFFGLRGPVVSALMEMKELTGMSALRAGSTTPRSFDKSHSQQRLNALGFKRTLFVQACTCDRPEVQKLQFRHIFVHICGLSFTFYREAA